MAADPCPVCGGDMRAANAEVLVERLPMHVNLGDVGNWASHIGWATVTRDVETGRNKIEIQLDEPTSERLGNMVEAFTLMGIGFAGIKRGPKDGR